MISHLKVESFVLKYLDTIYSNLNMIDNIAVLTDHA